MKSTDLKSKDSYRSAVNKMNIECMDCGKEQVFPNRKAATNKDWKFEIWSVATTKMRLSLCGDCYTKELMETYITAFKEKAEETIKPGKLPGQFIENLERPDQPEVNKGGQGSQSKSLTEF